MVGAVRRLREAGLPLALLSNNVAPMERTGALGELLGLFDAIVESSRVGLNKPDPRIYQLACDRLGVTPPESVFLDDLGANLKSARAMGMTTIKVDDPVAAVAELGEVLGIELGRPS
jgi:putative hydrolase of the HAD superfamily